MATALEAIPRDCKVTIGMDKTNNNVHPYFHTCSRKVRPDSNFSTSCSAPNVPATEGSDDA